MSPDASSVTWAEFGTLLGVGVLVAGGVAGFMLRAIGKIAEAQAALNKAIQDHRLEVAQSYATIRAVSEVERRLTDSLNGIMTQISKEMGQITVAIQQLFGELLRSRNTPPSGDST